MLPLSAHFPFSSARQTALGECEIELRNRFEELNADTDPVLKDAIHYILFKHKDRFCMTSAWLIARDLKLPKGQIAPILCALEFSRIAIGTSAAPLLRDTATMHGYLDPTISHQAVLSLQGMASELMLSLDPKLSQSIAASLAPAKLFSNTMSFMRAVKESRGSPGIEAFQKHRICPFFEATGAALDQATGSKDFRKFFRKLALLVQLAYESSSDSEVDMPWSQVMDLVLTVESEIIEDAGRLSIKSATLDIVEPVTELFEDQLQ